MADKLNFSKQKELDDWLKDKPVEWAQIIAWRAAMRAAPALGRLVESSLADQAKQSLIQSVYRSLLISSVARNWQAGDIETAVARAVEARTAAAAADARTKAATVWSAVSADADFLNQGKNPDELARTRLWPQGQPARLVELWQAHKQSALDFAPWFSWYEAAAAGEPFGYFNEKFSRRIALQPDKWWKRSAGAVNADVEAWGEKWRKRHDTLPFYAPDTDENLDDCLGVSNDAHIFARLLAARETKLPLGSKPN